MCLKRDKIISGCLIATHQCVLDMTSIWVYTILLSVPMYGMKSVGVKVKSMMGHKMNDCQLDGKVQENALSEYSLLYNKENVIK